MSRWFKQSSEAIHDPKWRIIAARAEATFIEAFGVFAAGLAWAAEHGGSLAGFDIEVEAAAVEIPLDRFKRIWQALIDKGLVTVEAMLDEVRIAAGRLTAWAKRQAPSPAPIRAPRSPRAPRSRERHKAAAGVVIDAAAEVVDGVARNAPPCTPLEETRPEDPPYSPPLAGGDDPPLFATDPVQEGVAPTGRPDRRQNAAAPPADPGRGARREPSFLLSIAGGRRELGEPTCRRTHP